MARVVGNNNVRAAEIAPVMSEKPLEKRLPSKKTPSPWISGWVPLLLILVATFVAYIPSFSGEFVYDDRGEILQNPAMLQRSSWVDVMFKGNGLPPRPLPYLTFAIDYAIHGERPFGYHCVNFAIHILIAAMLFVLARQVGMNSLGEENAAILAFSSCLLWALHPLATMCVTYVYQRMEQMVVLFQIAVLFFLWRSRSTRSPWLWLTLSLASCVAGMFTKENMIVAPLIALWFDRVFMSSSWTEIAGKRGLYHGLLWCSIAIVLACVWINSAAYPEFRATADHRDTHSAFEHLVSQPSAIMTYLRLSIFPIGLSIEHGWGVSKDPAIWLTLGLFVLGMVAAAGYLAMKRPTLGFLAGSFFVLLGPSSSIIPAMQTMSEHRMYLPLFVLLLLVCAISIQALRDRSPIAFPLAVGIAALILGTLTWNRNREYQDLTTIWRGAYASCGDRHSANVCNNYVKAMLNRADIQKQRNPPGAKLTAETKRLYEEARYVAYAIHKKHRYAYTARNLGLTHLELDELAEAQSRFLEAIEANPSDIESLVGLAKTFEKMREDKKAIQAYERLCQIDPNNPEGWGNLGRLTARTNPQASIEFFNRALELEPNNVDVISNRCIALVDLQRLDEALAELKRARAIAPNHLNVRRNIELLEGMIAEASKKKSSTP